MVKNFKPGPPKPGVVCKLHYLQRVVAAAIIRGFTQPDAALKKARVQTWPWVESGHVELRRRLR